MKNCKFNDCISSTYCNVGCIARNNAIADYLLQQGFTDSLDAFKREAEVVSNRYNNITLSLYIVLLCRGVLESPGIMDY